MTQRERTIRMSPGPQVGQIIELQDPWPDHQSLSFRWIVVGVSIDPAAVWNIQYEDEGDPEAYPDTVLLHLKAVA
jgi:hypothetical protein